MFKYHCLNPIAQIGLDKFTENYDKSIALLLDFFHIPSYNRFIPDQRSVING